MKKLAGLLGVAILGLANATMRADGIGLPVTGTLNLPFLGSTNWFNGALGFVPAGYGNHSGPTVIIGSGIEFGFTNGVDLITANFTGNTFLLSDTCVVAGCVNTPFHATFYNPDINGYTLQSVNFPNGVLFNFAFDPTVGGNVLVIDSSGSQQGNGGTLQLGYSAVPEPGTFGLLATGLLGAAGAIRRRFVS